MGTGPAGWLRESGSRLSAIQTFESKSVSKALEILLVKGFLLKSE
jgi:hypothetical protein